MVRKKTNLLKYIVLFSVIALVVVGCSKVTYMTGRIVNKLIIEIPTIEIVFDDGSSELIKVSMDAYEALKEADRVTISSEGDISVG